MAAFILDVRMHTQRYTKNLQKKGEGATEVRGSSTSLKVATHCVVVDDYYWNPSAATQLVAWSKELCGSTFCKYMRTRKYFIVNILPVADVRNRRSPTTTAGSSIQRQPPKSYRSGSR